MTLVRARLDSMPLHVKPHPLGDRYAMVRRILDLVRLMRPPGAPMEEMAARLQVSRRTVYRDLRALEETGLEVRRLEDRHGRQVYVVTAVDALAWLHPGR